MYNGYTLSIRQRTALPILLMTVGLAAVSSLLVSTYWKRLQQADGMLKAAQSIALVSDVIHELQKERGRSVLFINGKIPLEELAPQKKQVDLRTEELLSGSDLVNSAEIRGMEEKNRASLEEIRSRVLNRESAGKVIDDIGTLVDEWVRVQLHYADLHHLDGLEANLSSVAIFEKSKESMGRLRATLNSTLASNAPIPTSAVYVLSSHRVGVQSHLGFPGLQISDESRNSVRALLESEDWREVLRIFDRVVEKSMTGNYGYDARKSSETITRTIEGLKRIIDPEIRVTIEGIRMARQKAKSGFWICVSLVVALLVVCLGAAILLTRSTTRALAKVSGLLSTGSGRISLIASRMSDASQSLASATDQQAAALQETTSAIAQTSVMVKKNSENSENSNRLAGESAVSAEKGKRTMMEMIESIEDISRSITGIMSQVDENNTRMNGILAVIHEIGEKTKVINEIVFQTKLLSFNASVEAARAGEQGKGFSVVANDVGGLASMSGAASKEISGLLEKSILQVEAIVKDTRAGMETSMADVKAKVLAGTEKARGCGELLDEIAGLVGIARGIAGEISSASQEQSVGIDEISTAMSELDKVAQQNSTASREASASADQLKEQIVDLGHAVDQLDVLVKGSARAA